jgi:photosystem II stability/assembly factor-like uncharacterized protein
MRANSAISVLCVLVLCSVIALFMIQPAPTFAGVGTWTSGGPADRMGTIAVAPSDNQIVYALGDTGLWKTTNGGTSWTRVNPHYDRNSPLAIDPNDPNVVFCELKDNPGISRSPNSGFTTSTSVPDVDVTAYLIDPSNPQIVYAGIKPQPGSMRILKSTNGGVTWSPVTDEMIHSPGIPSIAAFTTDPTAGGVVTAAAQGYHVGTLMRTVNGGTTWANINSPQPMLLPAALGSWNRPTGGHRVYAGWGLMGQKALTRSDNNGASYSNISAALPVGQGSINSVVGAGGENTVVMALSGDSGGVFVSNDAGASWTNLAVPHAVQKVAYAATSRTIFATTDNGVWQYTFGASPGPGPGPDPGSTLAVNSRFRAFYDTYDGVRLLGAPISKLVNVGAYPSQYFEKGRMEDHSSENSDPNWRFMYGLLVDELQAAGVDQPVGGDTSTVTYATIKTRAAIAQRVAAPAGYPGGPIQKSDGNWFVPFTTDLSPAPGHNIYRSFWTYINDQGLFPGGWLHDVGLPITEPITATVTKAGLGTRTITVQAFQRTILTYDPANPPDWRTERANVGSDFKRAFPASVPD